MFERLVLFRWNQSSAKECCQFHDISDIFAARTSASTKKTKGFPLHGTKKTLDLQKILGV